MGMNVRNSYVSLRHSSSNHGVGQPGRSRRSDCVNWWSFVVNVAEHRVVSREQVVDVGVVRYRLSQWRLLVLEQTPILHAIDTSPPARSSPSAIVGEQAAAMHERMVWDDANRIDADCVRLTVGRRHKYGVSRKRDRNVFFNFLQDSDEADRIFGTIFPE